MGIELLQSFGQLLVFAVLCALVLSFLLTPAVIRLGFLLGMVDEPNERRIHTTPTPRCGGIGLFLSISLTLGAMCCLVGFPGLDPETRNWIRTVIPVGVPLILLGMADDKWEVSPLVKLLGQIAVAVLAWACGMQLKRLMGVELPVAVDLAGTVLLYVAAMNAYNLIDGMDGVASGLAMVTSLGLCGMNLVMGNEGMAAVCLVLTGACLGFLRYNFHPARVFLGDTGSLYLGYLLMSIALGSQARSTAAVLLIVPLLTMGVPMIDTALAIWRRSVRKAMYPERKGKVSGADKDHLHHRLARKGLTQRRVAVTLYALQAVVFVVGLMWVFLQSYRMAIFTVAFFVGSYVLLRYLASLEMTDSGRWIVDGIRRPGRMQLYNSVMPLLDVVLLSFSLVILSWLLAPDLETLHLKRVIREIAAPIIGGPMILLWATQYYRQQWTRARALDFFYLGAIATAGIAIGLAISPLPREHTLRHTLLIALVTGGLSIPGMLFLRVFPRLVQDMLHFHERRSADSQEGDLPRVLIYGAGYGFTLITRAESFDDTSRRRRYRLVGLIDDDPSLRGRLIHGHSVLGSVHDVETLVREHDVGEILVSTVLREDCKQALMRVADEQNLTVTQSVFANRILRERQHRDETDELFSEAASPTPA